MRPGKNEAMQRANGQANENQAKKMQKKKTFIKHTVIRQVTVVKKHCTIFPVYDDDENNDDDGGNDDYGTLTAKQ